MTGQKNRLTFALFEFKTKTLNSFHLPPYKGSTFRGAFGHTIKKIACVKKQSDCDGCLLKTKCIYSYIFETPPPEDSSMMKNYTAAPHPFILEPPLEIKTDYEKGEDLNFSLVLTGKAIDYLPYFIYAFDEMGKNGIGRDRGRYDIEEVINHKADRLNGTVIYGREKKLLSPPGILSDGEFHNNKEIDKITISFITPARIKYEEKFVNTLEFHIFMRNILRRISLLTYFHCNGKLDVDFKDIIEKAAGISVIKSDLQWLDWERYSNRQQSRMKMGGLIGDITFTGDLKDFLPYITTGKYIHVGKGASFGLGKYEIYF